ncbi:ras guanine nucleotide exchange factor domain-containing protein [Mortierella sp. GBAus27b]|nr:ras guanine nucleotide exchange factor domain-containing protein [Mortierella sp. GBAus27b]
MYPTREVPRYPPSIVLRYRSEHIAQQLCLIEREYLNQVQWYELVAAGWKKKPSESSADDQVATGPAAQSSHQTGAPNNATCHWVTSEIVKAVDLDMRVKVIEKFIRIAHTCYNHSNFSSLTQIMLGLQKHEVSRLSRTWSRVRPQEMRIMQDLVEFTSMYHNWKHLRTAMKEIADEWGCIPFLGVYLSDLLYNTELPSFVQPKVPMSLSPMINMHKHRTIATIIKRILTFRTMANRYPFVKDTGVYDQLMGIVAAGQSEMEQLSEVCEEKASSSALASPVFTK